MKYELTISSEDRAEISQLLGHKAEKEPKWLANVSVSKAAYGLAAYSLLKGSTVDGNINRASLEDIIGMASIRQCYVYFVWDENFFRMLDIFFGDGLSHSQVLEALKYVILRRREELKGAAVYV